jgi:hypothetical protein
VSAATDPLEAVLDRAEAAGAFGPDSPPDRDELTEAEGVRAIPPPLARVYARADGLTFEQVEVFDLGDYADVNGDETLFAQLPGTVFLGSDLRDGFFLFDPDRTLGETSNAVFWSDRSSLAPDECRLAAADLAGFLSAALDGKLLSDGPEVGTRSLDRLAAAIEANPTKVTAHPGYGSPNAMLAARDLGLPVPFGVIEFYERYDGLFLKDLKLEIAGLKQLEAIEGYGALRIGRDAAGRGYAVTTGGWRDLPENRLLTFTSPRDLVTAAPLGRFTDVLRIWIDERA